METLKLLFKQVFGVEAQQCEALKGSGSHRQYYRLQAADARSITGGDASKAITAIGVIGTDARENRAFLKICAHFAGKGLNVPRVLASSEDGMYYLQEDLGSTSLYDLIAADHAAGELSAQTKALALASVRELARIQYEGGSGMDWSVCYPDSEFNARMVRFDINYFKYDFLKPSSVEFDEIALQDDFDRLEAALLQDFGPTFMYRDFQSCNVMIKDGKPWFIDFQGGRRGPCLYDLASFAWQSRARFSEGFREELTEAYLRALAPYCGEDAEKMRGSLNLFVLFRTLQTLGAYGFRGLIEGKKRFRDSIPAAMDNIGGILAKGIPEYPELEKVLAGLRECFSPKQKLGDESLTVKVMSFSFRRGLPEDPSGNGGGYVFDCRSIHNPGRYECYKGLTGLDAPVCKFLEDDGEITVFLDHVFALVDAHVERYIKRGFSNLQIAFGCTGGQHRSAYSAEATAAHLRAKYNVKVELEHREKPFWPCNNTVEI